MKLLEMPWLPSVGEGFRADVRALREAPVFDPALARRLASRRLDISQLHSLARALPAQRIAPREGCIRLSILSNTTAEIIVPAVIATAPRHDLWIDASAPPFGSFASEAFDASSDTHARRNHFVLLALDHRGLQLMPCPGDASGAEETVSAALAQVQRLMGAIREGSGATVITQTLAAPAVQLFGSLDAQTPGTLRWLIGRFNARLRESPALGSLMLDVATLAEQVGQDEWHDPVQWNLGKFPFSQRVVPLYAEWVCRVIAAAKGKSRKCLVLDLDNTLWGGVIGDDGLAGVVLGQGSPQGEAHLAVQAAALMLRQRGVILAVSSKNDDAIARKMFREHPEMLLREEHIAVFQANWQDKATNLRAIAETLNIGINSLVFLDDNPAERQQVRLALPEVAVPELPEVPDYFANILLSAGYFESTQFTQEDRQRAEQYSANAARRAALGAGTDLEQYLESLAMQAHVSAFDAVGRARITQLINKTNQFNLTTRRYSEADVAAFEADASMVTLQIRLKDSYGDNGMISVVICKEAGDDLQIDTWLMSCRVLNRRVEEMVLNLLVKRARHRNKRRLTGAYCPTERNSLVKDHYLKLGFECHSQCPESTSWHLNVVDYTERRLPITVASSGN